MRRRALSGVLAAAVLVGGWAGVPGEDAGAASGEDLCVGLLRDMRLYCKEGIRDARAATGADCVSRRLEFERLCQ